MAAVTPSSWLVSAEPRNQPHCYQGLTLPVRSRQSAPQPHSLMRCAEWGLLAGKTLKEQKT